MADGLTLDISALRKMADTAAEMTETGRQTSQRCRDYFDSKQLTQSEVAVLKKRRQPPIIINRIRRKINAIVGIEQKGRVDPRALPRNPQDEDAADIATKCLVFADDITRFDVKRSQFCFNLAIEGTGGVEVKASQGRGGIDPEVVRLRWEDIFYDPYSRELDFSDAEYMGVQKWMTVQAAERFVAQWPGLLVQGEALTDMLSASLTVGSPGDTFDDRPADGFAQQWGDRKSKRIRLAYMYHLHEGEWRLSLFCGGGVLASGPSPYLDQDGRPENAIILQSCYIDRENQRYGEVFDMIWPQDEVNARRSKLLHQLNSRQTRGAKGAIADVRAMKRELASPDGHVEYEQDPLSTVPSFDVIQNADQVAGQFQLLQESKGEIDMLGPNASLLGQLEGQQSGRAIIAQQQAGMAEMGPFYDNLRDWTLRVYRALWNRIRQFWTEPRYVRVTDEQERVQFLGINGAPNQDGTSGPMLGQLDIDIIIDMTPEYASLQMEEFQQLAELAKSGMVPIPPDVLIEASQLRNKARLLEKMKGGDDPQAAQMQAAQQQMMMQMAQLEMRLKDAEGTLKEAQAMKAQAEAQATMAEIGRPEPGQPVEPPDQKPVLDFEAKRMALAEQAREHDDKMQLEWAKHRSDASLKRETAAADVGLRREQHALAREGAAADGKVKAAQAAKLRRPDPKPASASSRQPG